MRTTKEAAERAAYLLNVAARFIRQVPGAEEEEIEFDGAMCDGSCLAEDCEAAAENLQVKPR